MIVAKSFTYFCLVKPALCGDVYGEASVECFAISAASGLLNGFSSIHPVLGHSCNLPFFY